MLSLQYPDERTRFALNFSFANVIEKNQTNQSAILCTLASATRLPPKALGSKSLDYWLNGQACVREIYLPPINTYILMCGYCFNIYTVYTPAGTRTMHPKQFCSSYICIRICLCW